MCRNGQDNILEARPFIEKLASVAPIPYRARAMQLLAATYGTQRNPEQELSFFVESLKTRASTFLGLQGIALLKAKEGYHQQALKDLESLRSFARYMPPHIYFDYLNGKELDSRQLLLRLMELGVAPGMSDGKLLQVIQLMEKLLTEPQKPDDDEPGA